VKYRSDHGTREEVTLKRILVKVVQLAVVLAMPIFLLLTAGHLVINTWYIRYEYGKPDFPRDLFGFTQQQRLELATVSIQFLQSGDPPEVAVKMLADQRLPGTNRPLFEADELSHMVDVKHVTNMLWRVQYAAGLIVIAGLIWLLASRERRTEGYRALFRSGVLTVGLLAFLVLFVLVSWRMFFVVFHGLFFAEGTWTFAYSASLIRLYPDRLFFDAGSIITVGSLLAGAAIGAAGSVLSRRARRT
jgi:integral membrane protein (TIGR01906 family)